MDWVVTECQLVQRPVFEAAAVDMDGSEKAGHMAAAEVDTHVVARRSS
jgi:hypothetical protein